MKAIIYRITNSDTCYIGQTKLTLEGRWKGHESKYKSFINGSAKWCSSFIMFMNDEEPTIEILEEGEFESKKHLIATETKYIMANDCCNKCQQIEYENMKEYNKLYRKKNTDEHKDKINEKFNCECGGKYTFNNKVRHLKTKKHLDISNK
tara:strand:+ start:2009 stop:2458 length:450 start_codon:yes stop_codon:yes gene_type:complete